MERERERYRETCRERELERELERERARGREERAKKGERKRIISTQGVWVVRLVWNTHI